MNHPPVFHTRNASKPESADPNLQRHNDVSPSMTQNTLYLHNGALTIFLEGPHDTTPPHPVHTRTAHTPRSFLEAPQHPFSHNRYAYQNAALS